MATLKDFQDGTYNLDDLADMLEALAFKQTMERRAIERAKKDGNNI